MMRHDRSRTAAPTARSTAASAFMALPSRSARALLDQSGVTRWRLSCHRPRMITRTGAARSPAIWRARPRPSGSMSYPGRPGPRGDET